MDDRRPRTQCAKTLQQFNRCAAVIGLALLYLSNLFISAYVQREVIGTAIVSNGPEPVLWYRTYGVRSNADRNAFTAQRFDAREIRLDRGLAEAALRVLRRLLDTRLGV